MSWALALGISACTLLAGSVAAEPNITTDASSAAVSLPTVRDQWYLDPAATDVAPAISAEATDLSAQARDSWYLDESARHSAPARSHRDQEDA